MQERLYRCSAWRRRLSRGRAKQLLGFLLLLALRETYARQHLHTRSETVARQMISQPSDSQDLPVLAQLKGSEHIPHILHYIYLSGYDTFLAECEKPRAKMKKWQYDSCVEAHPHWEVKFWTQDMAEELLETHYSWFMPVWRSYEREISQADAIRPFILHHYGGMYLDLDNECMTPSEAIFHDYDAVLQGSGWEGVNNGMMASAPGHPMWMKLAEVLDERHAGSKTDAAKNHPLYQTGPSVLREAATRFLGLTAPLPGFSNKLYEAEGWTVMVYSVGEFFMPCWYEDLVCLKQYELGVAAGTWDMSNITGRHWFAGSWDIPVMRPKLKGRTH